MKKLFYLFTFVLCGLYATPIDSDSIISQQQLEELNKKLIDAESKVIKLKRTFHTIHTFGHKFSFLICQIIDSFVYNTNTLAQFINSANTDILYAKEHYNRCKTEYDTYQATPESERDYKICLNPGYDGLCPIYAIQVLYNKSEISLNSLHSHVHFIYNVLHERIFGICKTDVSILNIYSLFHEVLEELNNTKYLTDELKKKLCSLSNKRNKFSRSLLNILDRIKNSIDLERNFTPQQSFNNDLECIKKELENYKGFYIKITTISGPTPKIQRSLHQM